MNKKKVNLVFYGDYGLRRGKGMEVLATAESLLKSEMLNKVYVRDKGLIENKEMKKHIITSIPFGCIIPRILSGIKKLFIPTFQSRIWGEEVFDFFSSLRLKKNADILYISAGALRTLKKAKKMEYIVGQHCGTLHPAHNFNLINEEFTKFGINFSSKTFLNKMLEAEKNMSLYNFYVVLSQFTKDNYIENGISPDKIFVNPLGIELDQFKPLDKYDEKRKKTFIFIGSATLLKGVHYLLEAWKQLNLKDARLIIGGPTEVDDWEYIKKYADLPNVEFVGFVDPSKYYTQGIAFIFPSLTESFPRVVAEALASGIPVITTSPCSEAIRDGINGFLIPIRDIEAIKEKIIFFYNNPDKAIEMGKKAREIAEEYSWDKYEERVVDIMNKIL